MNDVEIVLDSWCPATGSRIATFRVCTAEWAFKDYVRHSALAALSVSSTRAETLSKARRRMLADPAVPPVFQLNATGMVGAGPADEWTQAQARLLFQEAVQDAAKHHERAEALGLSKQDANILIGQFLPTCFICTATEWNNFFTLRTAPDVKPTVLDLARKMQHLYCVSQPQTLQVGEYHLPLVDEADWRDMESLDGELALHRAKCASAARCAQQSYPGSTVKAFAAAVEMCENVLISQRHMSPLWHPACAVDRRVVCGPFVGYRPFRKEIPEEHGGDYQRLWDPVADFVAALVERNLLPEQQLHQLEMEWRAQVRAAVGASALGPVAPARLTDETQHASR